MTRLSPILMLIACLFIAPLLSAQDSIGLADKVLSFPTAFLDRVTKKASQLEESIITKSEKLLKQLAREEKRLQKKLHKKDALLAHESFNDAQRQYQSMQTALANKTSKFAERAAYVPFLDTITTSIRFLENTNAIPDNALLQKSLGSINSMLNRFQVFRIGYSIK